MRRLTATLLTLVSTAAAVGATAGPPSGASALNCRTVQSWWRCIGDGGMPVGRPVR
ncbi:hypothetical protein [Streptomyces anulatus]|uniref:hypothetical protein n=1 Tax=Streptomyces anulatus TaxID=1892 RepID=UPI0038697271|nr:hypothetical protein OG238_17960 [Streptomyces anulatus]